MDGIVNVLISSDGSWPDDLDGLSASNLVIDATRLLSSASKNFVGTILEKNNLIYAMRFDAAEIDQASVEFIAISLLGKLPNIQELNFSHKTFSPETVHHISRFIDLNVCGYCPLLRLVLTRCKLGLTHSKQIIQAAIGNDLLEELYMNYNKCTDAILPSLLQLLDHQNCHMKILAIGHNDFTADGSYL